MTQSRIPVIPSDDEKVGFVFCPACLGSGFLKSGQSPQVCVFSPQRHSLAWVDDSWISFDLVLSPAAVFGRQLRHFINLFIDGILVIFSLLGFIGLGATIFFQLQFGEISTLFHSQSGGLMLFWFSMMTNIFFFYRIEIESGQKKNIGKQFLSSRITSMPQSVSSQEFAQSGIQDISPFMDQDCLRAIDAAVGLVFHRRDPAMTPAHLLLALLPLPSIQIALGRLGVHPNALQNKAERLIGAKDRSSRFHCPISTQEFMRVLFESFVEAKRKEQKTISVLELFTALLKVKSRLHDIFEDAGISLSSAKNVVAWIHHRRELIERMKRWSKKASWKPKGEMNRSFTARQTPILDSVGIDFTSQARSGGFFPLIDRKEEMNEMFRIFEQPFGNILIVGDSGVGKTALLQGLAERMVSEEVPKSLADRRLVSLQPSALAASTASFGSLERRILSIINEIISAGNVVIAIDNIHELAGLGSGGEYQDALQILSEWMSQGRFHVIGVTTEEYYRRAIEHNPSVIRRFQKIDVDELKDDAAIEVVEAHSLAIESRQRVYFSYEAIEAAVQLSARYLPQQRLPSKALDVLEEAAVFRREKGGEKSIVTKNDIAFAIEQRTDIAVSEVTESEASRLLHIEDQMHSRIVNQNEAVNAVGKALRRNREELRDPHRPIANLLFCGPTGVGKTECAKTLADIYFGSEKTMIRFDMSEYQLLSSLDRLIGSALQPDQQGILTEAIRNHPSSLLLFDEIEKAHPNILNVFLQIMDDGRITDFRGQTVDCTNIFFIATTNAGSPLIQQDLEAGKTFDEIRAALLTEGLAQYFRPEFLNRFDDIIIFHPLSKDHLIEITKRKLKVLSGKLDQKGIRFEARPEAIVELAEKGFDPKFGARPLQRVIQDSVDEGIATLLLQHKVNRRDTLVLKKGGVIEVEAAPPV